MSNVDARTQEKREKLEEALERGVVMIHLDARQPGVLVPPQFREDFHLRLNLSWRFDPPDLSIGDWGIRQTLSFNRTPYKVAVPWQAIFAITAHTTDQAWLFPDSLPDEIVQAAARQAEQMERNMAIRPVEDLPDEERADGEPEVAPSTQESAPPRPFVPRLVEAPEEPPPEEPPPTPQGPTRRSHLRVVK